MNKVNLYDKIIPKGSVVGITVDFGTPKGSEFKVPMYPDDGYKFSIAYFILHVPPEMSANVIVETEKGEFTLLSTDATEGTHVIDASDLRDLDYINNFKLYAKVVEDTKNVRAVVLEYGGKQVIPYVG